MSVGVETVEVCTGTVTLLLPAGTTTNAGRLTSVGLSLRSVTATPPVGAGPDRVTVRLVVVPPVTRLGWNATLCRTRRFPPVRETTSNIPFPKISAPPSVTGRPLVRTIYPAAIGACDGT